MQCLKEASAVEADQAGSTAGSRDDDLVTAVKIYVVAPVKRTFGAQLPAASGRDHLDGNAVISRENDAAVAQCMGADGCQQDQPGLGFHDGAAGGHAVGSGTCCGGDDNSIRAVAVEELAVDRNVEIQDLQTAVACDDNVIEGISVAFGISSVLSVFDNAVQHHAALDLISSADDTAKGRLPMLYFDFRQISDISYIDTEDGSAGSGCQMGTFQYGAVAAQYQEAVQSAAEFSAHFLSLLVGIGDPAGFTLALNKMADLPGQLLVPVFISVCNDKKTFNAHRSYRVDKDGIYNVS